MITGKYQALFLQQEAKVVIHMARGRNGTQGPALPPHSVTVGELPVGTKGLVLMPVIATDSANHGHAKAVSKQRCSGGVVRVGMGADHPGNVVTSRSQNGLDMRFNCGTGVQHRNIARVSDQIGVGTRTGHRPRIGCNQPANAIGQWVDQARGQHVIPPTGE